MAMTMAIGRFASISLWFLILFAIHSYQPSMAHEDIEKRLKFEQGWPVLQEAAAKTIRIADGADDQRFTSQEYMFYYSTVYDMCKPMQEKDHCQELYDQYKKIFEDYITCKVLPSLRGMEGEILLRELARRWSNYQVITRWVSRFFNYLNRYFLPIRKLPSLKETSFIIFYDLVYGEMNDQVRDALITVINRERNGEQIDQAVMKNILAIYVEFGMDSMKYYNKDFEEAMVQDTSAFYSEKASSWIKSESYENYMLKAKDCLINERERAHSYLQSSSLKKLLEVVEHELLSVYASDLQEKKQLEEFPLTDTMIP
ncbi:Cullin domain-containing protein [Cephalotus follicularis]|uniref:Cullin domain-containing protein n=1 Tax=Cephalotus follicularis TaxID=3775 RepID=A0A1Q3D036_CEPFO|nr:Cullin domain-containing protein [Cephalotus follicularis]